MCVCHFVQMCLIHPHISKHTEDSLGLKTPAKLCLLKKPGDGLFILITTELFLGATHATCIKEYSHLYYDFSYLI